MTGFCPTVDSRRVRASPRSEPRRDRRARHPCPARARRRGGRGLLDGRCRGAARQARGQGRADRPAAGRPELPQHPGDHRRRGDDRVRGGAPRLRLPLRERRLRARVRGERHRLHRAGRRGHGADGRQGAREGRDARRGRAARAGHRRDRRAGRGARRGRRARLSGAPQGGGGRGRARHAARRGVRRRPELYERASAEALSAFGDGTMYVEKVITPARHVEIQVLATTTAPSSRAASANARSSAATRSLSRSRRLLR